MKKILIVLVALGTLLVSGCREAEVVNHNIKKKADSFQIRRKFIALNTRSNEPLFTVEGLISINTDTNSGDINVNIKTGEDEYKLFYAHLSNDTTYVVIQLDDVGVNPYAYEIDLYPVKEHLINGMFELEYNQPKAPESEETKVEINENLEK